MNTLLVHMISEGYEMKSGKFISDQIANTNQFSTIADAAPYCCNIDISPDCVLNKHCILSGLWYPWWMPYLLQRKKQASASDGFQDMPSCFLCMPKDCRSLQPNAIASSFNADIPGNNQQPHDAQPYWSCFSGSLLMEQGLLLSLRNENNIDTALIASNLGILFIFNIYKTVCSAAEQYSRKR